LWPRSPLRGIEPGNAASLAIGFEGIAAGEQGCGCLSSLFLGDLDDQAQALLLATGRVRPVDVVKVAHHGSSDQDGRLYARLRATVGLIGVGAENAYGHPTRGALDALATAGTVPARSDLSGLVLVSPVGGGGVRQWSERG